MSPPTISVVTPTYRHPENLLRALESVVNQVGVMVEHLIVGDASEVQLASDAVRSLATGSQHRTVYNTLQKARTKRKMEKMFLWEGTSPENIAEKLAKLGD